MKRLFNQSFLILLAWVLTGAATQAQTKIGLVNLTKVFDNYWKTKQADAELKSRALDFEKAGKGMLDDYQKAQDDYNKLNAGAFDQSLSSDERDKRKKSAEAKLLELKEIQQSLQQFDQQTRATLGTKKQQMRDNLLQQIREVLNAKAKNGGFALVLDSAGETMNQTPVVLYSSEVPDLTDDVLTTLNVDAPKKTDEKPVEKTDEKKSK